ncbi:MAG TPA: TIGR04282 family arsenosugar biosynthesis glycosyltransferase [Syntrophorhabdaceae bacterium]|nr:TIGR04282 family arsenosugar biosynthesis glycosyltransferase [Syntrophorhabdaceae bacterium]
MFVKAPRKGMVKSRLAACLGEEITLALYKSFVLDLAKTLRAGEYPSVISFFPPDARPEMEKWLGTEHVFAPQHGKHLGERMKNAFTNVFTGGAEAAILVGADIPDLTADIFGGAFRLLNDHDSILGPSYDGGYYLIGFNRNHFTPSVFEDIDWGTTEVFRQTVGKLIAAGSHIYTLPEHRDIDTFEDLAAFYRDHSGDEFVGTATMRCIRSEASDFVNRLNSKRPVTGMRDK